MSVDSRFIFDQKPAVFFEKLTAHRSFNELAHDAAVSPRTLRAWRSGETSMPANTARVWSSRYGVTLPGFTEVSIEEKRRAASPIGGKARQVRWGNVGTPAGRRKGGQNSIKAHRKNSLSPFVSRSLARPKRNRHFAELVGAILGDGGMSKYQFKLYSNLIDETEYADFLAELVTKVFGVVPSVLPDKKYNLVRVTCSRSNAVRHLQDAGLDVGNKVTRQADVPVWIKCNTTYTRACLRGLVDTDGCVYIDRHHVKNKSYASLCIAFTNASIPLLDFVENAWKQMGYSPSRFGRHIRLRRRTEVLDYARRVGFSNSKHSLKIGV